jgi:isoquinoline 1-oxidoreductase
MSDQLHEEERFELREAPAYLFSVSRRQFLETAGAGFFVIAIQQSAQGQRPSGGSLEAPIHFGEGGEITIIAGKVEEGQGPRTELAIAAAEELRVPVERIRMVMADTDLTPNDGTTAGSRTTPSTVPLVRKAGAVARDLLISAAAEKWGIERQSVKMSAGNAAGPEAGQTLTYGDLARSPELKNAYGQPLPADVAITPAKDWQVLGKPRRRVNGGGIVTGAHQFPSDIQRPGML